MGWEVQWLIPASSSVAARIWHSWDWLNKKPETEDDTIAGLSPNRG